MSNMNREQMMEFLKTLGVDVRGTTEQFSNPNLKGGIWIAADGDNESFNYYSEEWSNTFGVNPKLNRIVDKRGWFFEWWDAGTMLAWPC